MKRTLFILAIALCSQVSMGQGSFSPYQKSVLDFWYAQAKTNGLDGAWIIDSTIPKEGLETNVQYILDSSVTNVTWSLSDSYNAYVSNSTLNLQFSTNEVDYVFLGWLATNTYVKVEIDPLWSTFQGGGGSVTGDVDIVGDLDVTGNLTKCAVYRSEAGQSADATTNVVIQWDNEDIEDSIFTHDTVTSNSVISVSETGRYLLTGVINYYGTTSNYGLTSRVTVIVNGTTTLPNIFDGGYIRAYTGANELSIPVNLIVELTAGDYFEIQTIRLSTTTGNGIINAGTTINIVKL